MPLRAAAISATFSLAAVGLAAAATSLAAPSPKPQALVLATAPAGFSLTEEDHAVTDADVAKDGHVALATVRRWGRLGGYRVEFVRNDDRVRSTAAVYTSAAGAQSALRAESADASRGLDEARRPPVSLGQQTVYYALKSESALAWRDRSVIAVLYSRGISVDALVKLARVQEARIQRAFR